MGFYISEVTNMTAYFKIGEHNRLWMLFVSSVTVSPKFQDAYGYIPSLKTFTGRHSPIITCPDFMTFSDNEKKSLSPKSNCSMCNISHEEDEQSSSYCITYKMLADYIEQERDRLLAEMKISTAIIQQEVALSPMIKWRDTFEDLELAAKAGAIFAVLDTLF